MLAAQNAQERRGIGTRAVVEGERYAQLVAVPVAAQFGAVAGASARQRRRRLGGGGQSVGGWRGGDSDADPADRQREDRGGDGEPFDAINATST